jgi:putative nucleotidyltransferase with HDIG domain
MTYKILLVDDEPSNLRLLERLFRRDYHVLAASSGAEALDLLNRHDVALLITDQRMPGMTGIELLKKAAELRPHMVRIILSGYADMSALVEAINCGQVYRYLTKPWSNDDLRLTVERGIEHYESNKSRFELELANQRLKLQLQHMTRGVARAIADSLEAKDEHIYGHARRVSGYATAIGRRMRLSVQSLESISLAAFLHDIGKIGTPDRILLKPSALNDEERDVLQQHSERGARILASVPDMDEVATAVRHHHEHFDGSGYPEKLAGDQIPLVSRIILVADAYDAMTSPRPFRQAYGHETALERLRAESGLSFDPQVVEAFLGLEELGQIRASIKRGFCGGRLSNSPINIGETSFEELLAEVEAEPTLAIAVLQQANATMPARPAISLREACAQLELSELHALAMQNSVSQRCDANGEQLWEHSIRCAIASKLLAEYTGQMDPAEAYTLGLLHDIGEVLLRSLFPETMESILWFGDTDARLEREVATFGVDHAQVGQWILDLCGLPRTLTTAVQMHHDAARVNSPIVLLLNVANSIAQASDSSEIATLDALGTDRLLRLGLNRGHLARIHEQTSKALEEKMPMIS